MALRSTRCGERSPAMTALLSTRFRRWLFFAVGVPLGAWLLQRTGETLEARSGPSKVTDGLKKGGHWLERNRRR